jgi:hypothetical protein
MKKNLLLALLTLVVAPATFQVEAAYENTPAETREARGCGCRVRAPKPCAKKTCTVKPHVCKKACPFKSKCLSCEERAAKARAEQADRFDRSEMNENLDEDYMMNSDLE